MGLVMRQYRLAVLSISISTNARARAKSPQIMWWVSLTSWYLLKVCELCLLRLSYFNTSLLYFNLLTAGTSLGVKLFRVLNTTINIKDILWRRLGNYKIWRIYTSAVLKELKGHKVYIETVLSIWLERILA
jgi:hypothetical protein